MFGNGVGIVAEVILTDFGCKPDGSAVLPTDLSVVAPGTAA